MTLTTGTILDKIVANTAAEVARRRKARPLADLRREVGPLPAPRDAIAPLRQPAHVALIAECKHASPSAGVLIADYEPARLAAHYVANGAAAISVLTDEAFFQGHLDHLRAVRGTVEVPVLRKDFIIDPYQVVEARAAGADIVLLIAAALEDDLLADLKAQIEALGMTALIEVHNQAELDRVLRLEPTLLGVNNRDLKTFTVDLQTTARLIAQVPGDVTFVAESGIKSAGDVRRMGELGAHAVLVGEALVRGGDVRAFARQGRP
ncbi:MAG: indole-3-glycerol phosphate synthase TrpC [Anaerolineae bacterium]